MSKQERVLDAAEYVIGTMSAVERSAFEALIESDPDTKADVLFWERTFGALNASVSPNAPPETIWKRIEAALPSSAQPLNKATASSLAQSPAANDNLADKLRRSRGRWRMGALAASIAALALGAFVVNERFDPLSQKATQIADGKNENGKADALGGKEYIAVVNANGDQPSLVINIDAKSGAVTVRSIGVEKPDGKSLELWYVPEGKDAVSVGLVGEGGIDLQDLKANQGDLLAISVEPPGGSPTGVATGPVIYTGKLIENVNSKK